MDAPRDIWMHSNPKYGHNHDPNLDAETDVNYMSEFREEVKKGMASCSQIWNKLAK